MSTVMMERTGTGMAGVGFPGTAATVPQQAQTGMNLLMVPRCTYQIERCEGGLRITCKCDDKMAAQVVQNLCSMLAGGMCSVTAMLNGMTVCCCNLTMGLTRCEATKDGVRITCTSGDAKCAQMLQSCCDCLNTMLQSGCTCCVLMSGTPLCCGTV